MHFHLPKPIHGWRGFAGEVGIIVIGVLIALGAEQAVEWVRWHNEVSETKAALDEEIANNVGLYRLRSDRATCAKARLLELDDMLATWSKGETPDRTSEEILGEPTNSSHTAVWKAAIGGSGANTLPLEQRLRYGIIYDEIDNNDGNRHEESELWSQFAGFDREKHLDSSSRIALRRSLTRLKRLYAVDESNFKFFDRLTEPMQIHPHLLQGEEEDHKNSRFCAPLLVRRSAHDSKPIPERQKLTGSN